MRLTREEREFLAEKVGWEILEIDTEILCARTPERKQNLKRGREFYDKLYKKLTKGDS